MGGIDNLKQGLASIGGGALNLNGVSPSGLVVGSSLVGAGLGASAVGAGLLVSKARKRKARSRKSKAKRSYSRKGKKRKARRRSYARTAGKRKDRSSKRIRMTKSGQPYIILANGRAKFISKRSAKASRKRRGGRY